MLLSKDIGELCHSGLIHVSLLCGEEMQPVFFFILLFSFSGCVSFQALCLQKVLREGQVHNKCFLAERNSESVLVHQGWLPPEKHKLLVLN